jgi:hypothetical protein
MKYTTFLLTGILWLSMAGTGNWLQAKTDVVVEQSETDKLVEDALTIARRSNVDQLRAAIDQVLSRTDLKPAQRVQLHLEMGRVYNMRNRRADAEKEYSLALAVREIAPAERVIALEGLGDVLFPQQFINRGIQYTYRDTWLDRAMEAWQEALTTPGLSNEQKIRLHSKIANVYLEKRDVAAANRELEAAIALSGISAEELAQAKLNYARALVRQYEREKAKVLFDEILEQDIWPRGANRKSILIQERSLLEPDLDARIAYLKGQGVDLYDILNGVSVRPAEVTPSHARLAREVLADAQTTDPRRRFAAYQTVMHDYLAREDYDSAKAWLAENKDEFWDVKVFASPYNLRLSHEFSVWVGENLLLGEMSEADRVTAARLLLEGARRLVLPDKAIAAIEILLPLNEKMTGRMKMSEKDYWSMVLQLTVLRAGNHPARAAKAVAEVLQEAGDLDASMQIELLLEAARHANDWKYDAVAKRLLKDRDQLVVQYPKPSLSVAFLQDAPQDITAVLQSEWFRNEKNRGLLNRPFRGNLQLLAETDTASIGRVLTQADGSAVQLDTTTGYGMDIQQSEKANATNHTMFTFYCNEEGVYLFFFVPVEQQRLQQIRKGFGRIGSFEIYLAEGYYDPYTALIFNAAPTSMVSIDGARFPTQYPNRFFRPKVLDQNMRFDSRIVEDGIATLIFFDWEGFLQLPKDGDQWAFEAIHYESGGQTWGGSRGIHWKKNMGNLVFENMSEENRTAIQRRLLAKAKEAWTWENAPGHNGYIEFWQDNQLGDQTFYDEILQSLVEKYNAYAERIKVDMSDAEVREVFDEAYLFLIHNRFEVEDRRYRYLRNRILDTGF